MALYRGKKTKRRRRKRSNLSKQYRSSQSIKAWRNIAIALTCLAIFAVGFFLLGPALDGAFDKPDGTSSQNASALESEDISEQTSEDESSADSSSNGEDEPQQTKQGSFFLTAEIFTDPEKLSAVLLNAQNQNIKTLVLELKGYDGRLNYLSSLEKVRDISAISENAVDLSAIIGQINSAGLECAASLQIFDELYTASELRETAIKYNNSATVRWLDYTREEPCAWQDPGLAAAKAYELDIIAELCEFNLTQISLSGCHYPVWGNHNGMTPDTSRTKIENITDFISEAHAKAVAAGIKLDVTVTADVAVNDRHSRIENYGYPEDLASLDCDSITADFRLDRIITRYYAAVEIKGEMYSDLTSNPEQSLTLLYAAAKENLKDKQINVLVNTEQSVIDAENVCIQISP